MIRTQSNDSIEQFEQENPASPEEAFIGSGNPVFSGILVSRAIKAADEDEVDVVRGMAGEVSALKGDLDALVADVPARGGVEDVERALSDLTQRIYRALRQRLPPAEWHRVREVIRDVSGEEPG